jgi:hypothetical protein
MHVANVSGAEASESCGALKRPGYKVFLLVLTPQLRSMSSVARLSDTGSSEGNKLPNIYLRANGIAERRNYVGFG